MWSSSNVVKQHKQDTRDVRATRMQRTSNTNHKNVTQVKNFNFKNSAIENIFSHLRISYISKLKITWEKQLPSENRLLEMPRPHPKMSLKKAPQKLNLAVAKTISKNYTLDCSC